LKLSKLYSPTMAFDGKEWQRRVHFVRHGKLTVEI